jgi:hypothetical protein
VDRSTHTIGQQVEAMKAMVNDFADYARTPEMQDEPFAVDTLYKRSWISTSRPGQDPTPSLGAPGRRSAATPSACARSFITC